MTLMKQWRSWWWSVACFLAAPVLFGAESPGEADAILERAIKAKGGTALLARFNGHIAKGRGILHRDGHRIKIRYDCFVQDFERERAQIVFDTGDLQIKSVVVVDQDRGWVKNNDDPAKLLAEDRLQVEKAGLYLTRVTWLLPVKDPAFRLTALGTVKLPGRETVGLQVSRRGQPDVKLYFDRCTWLLYKAEQDVVNIEDGIPSTLEMFPSDYRNIRHVQSPFKIALRYGEMPYAEYRHTELQLVERLDDHLFAMPATARRD